MPSASGSRPRALPMASLLHLYIGTVQEQRVLELEKAAVTNNARRVEALYIAGIDVNACNEYGQTALFVAIWKRSRDAAEALLRVGADPTIGDFSRCTPSMLPFLLPLPLLLTPPAVDNLVRLFDGLYVSTAEQKRVTVLIDEKTHPQHAGAGAFMVDDCLSEGMLCHLDRLFLSLPLTQATKKSCSDRALYCDAQGFVQEAFRQALREAYKEIPNHTTTRTCYGAFPNMRFLHYRHVGGSLPAHIDLTRTDENGVMSTHTFILYLTNCDRGGETLLLETLPKPLQQLQKQQKKKMSKLSGGGGALSSLSSSSSSAGAEATEVEDVKDEVENAKEEEENLCVVKILASVKPRRGRMLVFPHVCPHEGKEVHDVPKLLLRGELYSSLSPLDEV